MTFDLDSTGKVKVRPAAVIMGKRRRGELNESEGEDSAAPPTAQPAKRARAENWSFPDELQSAVGGSRTHAVCIK